MSCFENDMAQAGFWPNKMESMWYGSQTNISGVVSEEDKKIFNELVSIHKEMNVWSVRFAGVCFFLPPCGPVLGCCILCCLRADNIKKSDKIKDKAVMNGYSYASYKVCGGTRNFAIKAKDVAPQVVTNPALFLAPQQPMYAGPTLMTVGPPQQQYIQPQYVQQAGYAPQQQPPMSQVVYSHQQYPPQPPMYQPQANAYPPQQNYTSHQGYPAQQAPVGYVSEGGYATAPPPFAPYPPTNVP